MTLTTAQLESFIRNVPDFPKPGIVFKDITPLLRSADALASTCAQLAEPFRDQGITIVAGIESRGFIFGSIVAQNLGAGFVPIRKPGKLPHERVRIEYELEYGNDALEAHADAVTPGQRVLLVDDVLATGGTAAAAAELIRRLGGDTIGAAFLLELGFLKGRARLEALAVNALLTC